MSKGNSPAFPCVDKDKRMWTGMNLRDYFALEASHGLIEAGHFGVGPNGTGLDTKELAINAYAIADAMLDEREKYR